VRRGDDDAAALAAAAGRRRLACWLAACGAGRFAVEEDDAPPSPGWLARAWGGLAPWQRRPVAIATGDARSLRLPRETLARLGSRAGPEALLPALGLGVRAASRGGAGAAHLDPLERDVVWVLEGALVDAALAHALPGLAPAIAAARRDSLAGRPNPAALRPAERAVEALVVALLGAPAAATPRAVARLVEGVPGVERLRRYARRVADSLEPEARRGYRGFAPVPHWGAPNPPPGARAATSSAASTSATGRGRRLPRRVQRRAPDPNERSGERGPFLLPTGDAKLSVQDARGLDRPPDRGDEDLDALADELARLPELPILATEHPVREVLEDGAERAAAEARSPRLGGPVAPAWVYPEWDHRSQRYRRRGCVLREVPLAADPRGPSRVDPEHAAVLRRLRRQFESLRPRRRRVPRRLEGDGVDLDGWVQEHAERRAGLAPSGRVYTEERRERRDVAVALLLDASGSTDGWVSRSQRVIDVAKLAALCLGEALAALGDRHALYAFSGQGPGDVRLWDVKRFDEPWGDRARTRLAALEPDRFTRLGAPIRHVTASLCRSGARLRLLLLLSDGKPNDEDVYEGEYGIEDARQAVVEARALGVRPFCITIDREGPTYLPRLFGPNGYTVLQDVEQLPQRLVRVYRRLAIDAGA
jgi:nitric oxide reductase NorD protein